MRRSLSAACLALLIGGCASCYPGAAEITVKQHPGAIVVANLNCTY